MGGGGRKPETSSGTVWIYLGANIAYRNYSV